MNVSHCRYFGPIFGGNGVQTELSTENQRSSRCFQLVASFLLAAADLSPRAGEHDHTRFSLSHEIVTSRLSVIWVSQPFLGFTALKRSHRCTISVGPSAVIALALPAPETEKERSERASSGWRRRFLRRKPTNFKHRPSLESGAPGIERVLPASDVNNSLTTFAAAAPYEWTVSHSRQYRRVLSTNFTVIRLRRD